MKTRLLPDEGWRPGGDSNPRSRLNESAEGSEPQFAAPAPKPDREPDTRDADRRAYPLEWAVLALVLSLYAAALYTAVWGLPW